MRRVSIVLILVGSLAVGCGSKPMDISQLYEDPEAYNDKSVAIIGRVIGVNEEGFLLGENCSKSNQELLIEGPYDPVRYSGNSPKENQVVKVKGICRCALGTINYIAGKSWR